MTVLLLHVLILMGTSYKNSQTKYFNSAQTLKLVKIPADIAALLSTIHFLFCAMELLAEQEVHFHTHPMETHEVKVSDLGPFLFSLYPKRPLCILSRSSCQTSICQTSSINI